MGSHTLSHMPIIVSASTPAQTKSAGCVTQPIRSIEYTFK